MILPIYIFGQPVLRKVAEDITPDYPQLKELISDMWETLAESEGIGLAAPQIGKAIRLSVIDLDVISEDLPEYKGFRQVFINPHIVEYDDSKTDSSEEGCLSLPAIHEKVVRPTRIHVEWDDEERPHLAPAQTAYQEQAESPAARTIPLWLQDEDRQKISNAAHTPHVGVVANSWSCTVQYRQIGDDRALGALL